MGQDRPIPTPRSRRKRWIRVAVIALLASPLLAYVLRYHVQRNFAVLVPDKLYRSAAPTRIHLTKWKHRHGIRSTIDLRGSLDDPRLADNRQMVRELGVTIHHIPLYARYYPTPGALRQLVHTIETVPKPALIHCAGGADRTGLASVIGRMALAGDSYQQARGQLSWRYLKLDYDPAQLCGVVALYEQHCRQRGLPTDGWDRFGDWATRAYYNQYYTVTTHGTLARRIEPGQPTNVTVHVGNRLGYRIPSGEPGRSFHLAVRVVRLAEDGQQTVATQTLPFPHRNVRPTTTLTLTTDVRAPRRAGRYELRVRVVEDFETPPETWDRLEPLLTLQVGHAHGDLAASDPNR